MLLIFIAFTLAGASNDCVRLEKIYQERGVNGILAAVHKLRQPQDAEYAAKALTAFLTSGDSKLEAAAAHCLGRMGKAGKAVLPEIANGLYISGVHPEWSDQYDLGDIPLWLAEALLRPDDPSFEKAAFVLAFLIDLRSERRLLPILIEGARHTNPDVRLWSVRALGEMEDAAASAQPLLVDILKTEPPHHLAPDGVTKWNEIRGDVAVALGRIGVQPDATIGLLTEMLKHPADEVWTSSALGLGQMGSQAASAIPDLVDALSRDQASIAWKESFPEHPAGVALRNIGELAIPGLARALKHKQPEVRRRAVQSLIRMVDQKPALRALVEVAAQDEDRQVRLLATSAMCFQPGFERNDSLVLQALVRLVDDEDVDCRGEAARVLANLKPPTVVPSALVVKLLSDHDVKVRLAAAEAFQTLSPDENVLSTWQALLSDQSVAVRNLAKKALTRASQSENENQCKR